VEHRRDERVGYPMPETFQEAMPPIVWQTFRFSTTSSLPSSMPRWILGVQIETVP